MSSIESDRQILDTVFGKSNLNVSLDRASRRDPDKYASDLSLATDQGVPVGVVERNTPEIQRRQKLSSVDIVGLQTSYPKLTDWLKDEDNASVSIDDLDILKGLEDRIAQHDRTWGDAVADTAIDVSKGVVGLGEAAVGLADFLTFNLAGDGLAVLGYDPEATKQIMGEYYSNARKRADYRVARAKGFVSTLGALVEDFGTSGIGTIVESAPMMLGTAAAARATALKLLAGAGLTKGTIEASKFLARPDVIAKITAASAATEGAITAGQIQEGARAGDVPYYKSVAPALTAGALTALIGKYSSKILPDVEAGLATASLGGGKRATLIQAGKEIAKGAIKEGLLEELPQSAQEQVFTNLAMGLPWDQGVGSAAAQGLVAGTGMGGGMATGTQVIAVLNGAERQVKATIKSINEQDTLDQIISYAQSSTTRSRAAGRFEDFINTIGADRDVMVPAEAAMQMEDAPDYITDQIDGMGADVAIPLRKFANEIAPNENWMGIIRPHIKLSEGSLSQQEINDGEADRGLKELLKRAQASQETLTEADRIFETVRDQLVATGAQSEQTARHSAALYPARAAVMVEMAKKIGKTLSMKEAFEMMGFRVEGEQAATAATDTNATILNQKQDFQGVKFTEDRVVAETGETVTVTQDAQRLWDQTQKRRGIMEQLRTCLNGA